MGGPKLKCSQGLTQLLSGFTPFLQAGLGKGLDEVTVTSFQLLCNSAFILPFCLI